MKKIWTYTRHFEGMRIYESSWMPVGSGIALPGIGILVSTGGSRNLNLLRHEFGHILQARQIGTMFFYFRIGLPSLLSAMRNNKRGHRHESFWTEVWANALAREYFLRKRTIPLL